MGTTLGIDFHPSGETVFNTDDLFLYIGGTAFAFSDATFTSTYFEWSNSGLSWTSGATVEVRLGGQPGTAPLTPVPSDWSLIPAGLTGGDQFRLLFLSQTKYAATDTDIADYNTFIQTLAAAGHTDIQAYSDGFTVVGCTANADAVDNTGTTGVGVPIYWLNGAKVADDYADFYDGDWDEEAVNKNELGENGRNTSNSNNYPHTGCDHDGTEAFSSIPQSQALGADAGVVRLGRPNSTTTGHGPLSSNNDTVIVSNTRPMYGLSAVFQVPDTTAPSPESAEVAPSGDRVTVAFDEDLDIAVEFLPAAVVNAFTLTENGVELNIDTIYSPSGPDLLTMILPTGTTISQNQTVTISYDQTAAGTDALEDAAGNEVASFTDFAVTNNSAVDLGRLSARLENLPSSHDGSTAFTVTLRFNTDISDDSIDNLDEATEITNGTRSNLAAVGSSKRNFTMTITPSSEDPVRIRVRKSEECVTSYSICTDARQVLDRGLSRWVTTTDEARLRALWLTRKYGSWVGGVPSGTYGYSGRVDLSVSELKMQIAPYARGVTIDVTGPAGTFTPRNRYDGGKTVKLDLPEGSTTWTVTVTSPDDTETRTYVVTVSRSAPGPADVRLKTLTVTPINGTLLSFNPSFHLGTQASTFRVRVSSGTTAVTVSVEKNSSDPEVRLMRTETDRLDAIDQDPDLAGVQFDLEMDRFDLELGRQNRYRSIWVIGPNARVEGHTVFNRRVYQLWITKVSASMATEAEPLMAAFENPPLSHDGSSEFTLRMAFSEDVEITPEDMRDHALTVLGGTVTGAEQVEGLKTLWDLTLQPSGNGPVSILTPLNRACTEVGALCTADGGTLTVAPGLQIAGPPPAQVNNPATGAPTVTGTAQVGETLTADTSAIADADGLANVSYSYEWIRNDGTSDTDITGATDSTYSLDDADEGKTIKVKVGFTDDAGSDESLTSAATASVAARPDQGSALDTPDQPVGTAVFVGGVDLEWNDVPGADSYDVQLFRNGQWTDLPGDGVEIAFYGAGAIISELDPGSTHWFQVRARNAHGSSDWSNFMQVGSTNQSTLGKRARPDNVTASGAPVINGTAQVGESLTADAAGIEDGNGLDRVQFGFQWVTNDGSADADITGATDSTYTLVAADEGKTVKVRVSFTDRGGYAESLTSDATDTVSFAVQQQVANSPATGALAVTGAAQVGQTLTADTSAIADTDGLTNVSYSYQWVANDGTNDTDITGATGSGYTLVAADEGKIIKVKVGFTDDAGHGETLTSAATGIVAAALLPLTVSLENNPATHNGTDVFTFEIRFSEEFPLSFRTLKFHALQVTGGTVKKALRVDNSSDIHWRITVRPDADGNVTIVLPVTNDCDDQGAICTGDGRMLSNSLEFTVAGPGG